VARRSPRILIRARLNQFLLKRKAADPDHYSDLSLAVVKLMGPGEYVLAPAGEKNIGHFALAAHDYTHSTAPNRRFADHRDTAPDQGGDRDGALVPIRTSNWMPPRRTAP